MRKLLFAIHLVAAVPISTAVISSQAWAQTGDRPLALDLFEQGRALLKNGDPAGALQKFEAAAKHMRTFGILLNVAECQEKLGRTASAWATWREARAVAVAAGNAEDEALANERQAALEQKLSRLTTVVSPNADIPMLEVLRDGASLPRAAWGSPAPVDPGKHVIEARAPGKVALRLEITVGPNGEARSITITPLESEPAAAAPVDQPQGTDASSETPYRSGKAQRTAGIVVGSLGVSTLIGATIVGLSAQAKHNSARNNCPNDLCDDVGAKASADARSLGNVSKILFGVGAALTAGGAVLYFVAPGDSPSTRPAAQVSVGFNSVGIVGQF